MLKLSFLGTFDARLDNAPVKEFESSKVRALLVYLLLEADRPHSRDHLAGLFWGESNDETASKNLRQALSNLRKAVREEQAGQPLLNVTTATIQVNKDVSFWLDVLEFERLLAACYAHSHRRLENCNACASRLQTALSLYRGSFLEGFFLKEAAAFQDWIIIQREHYHQEAVDALQSIITYARQHGQIGTAIAYTQKLVAMDPWREEAHIQLMQLFASDGQRSAALKHYERCRRILLDELGLEPQESTLHLAVQIRSGAFQPFTANPSPNNLPLELTSFVGREAELFQVAEHIQGRDHRLVTLIGPGGIGKTRLALQAARDQLYNFRDGVFWVRLEGLVSPDTLPLAIADAVGFSFPSSGDARLQLLGYLRKREMLIVLDNFEHLLEGADLVNDILQQAPDLTFLVTSRQPLRLQAESLLELGGLSLETHATEISPAPKDDVQSAPRPAPVISEAVRLFIERAQRTSPSFSITPEDAPHVQQICQLLDGMPLGIELAAAWVRQYSCHEIVRQIEQNLDFLASQLRDTPDRHRSLRSVFEHTWDMLTVEEKGSFASLSVFPASFNRPAAQEVCATGDEMLDNLWQKSLLRQSKPGRYSLHPLLKQYAAEKRGGLTESASSLDLRFQSYYADMASRLEHELQSELVKSGLVVFSEEMENFLHAWDLALAELRLEILETLLAPLFWYFEIEGNIYAGHILFQKAARALDELTDKSAAELHFEHRLAAYNAWLKFRRSELDASITQLQNLIEQGLDTLDPGEQIFTMTRISSAIFEQGRKEEARKWIIAALQRCENVTEPWEVALCHNHYGSMLNMLGELDRAEEHLNPALRIAEEHGFLWIEASVLSNLAIVAYFREDYRAAISIFLQSNEKAISYGDVHHSPSINHNNLADCYLQLGELEKAHEHLNLALYHFNECGNSVFLPYVYNTLASIHLTDGKPNEARQCLDSGLAGALEHNMFSVLNTLLTGYARYFFTQGDGTRSTALISYVLSSPDTIKEGLDTARKLQAELTETFGAHIWDQAEADPLTRTDILTLIKG